MKKQQSKRAPSKTVGLSTKNYNPSCVARIKDVPVRTKVERKPLGKGAGIAISAIAAILVLAIIAGIILLVLNYKEKNYRINYPYEDLSPFVSLDRSAYAGYTVRINVPEVNDRDVENAIIQQLMKKKGDVLYDGDYYSDAVLAAGDKAYIWYRGYELDENGNRTEPSGTCNFYGTSAHELELGSGSFITGFELDLIGHKMSDSSKFVKRTEGEILDGDIVYLTGTCSQEVGEFYSESNIIIDLADPDVESVWGVGIGDYLKSIGIGGSSQGVKELVTPAGDHVIYTGLNIQFATDHAAEDNPIVVKTVFPHDYNTESLRNKTVYFEVYIEKTLHYQSAEFNEEFIESLGFSADDLQEYEGEGLVEKYKAYIRQLLENKRQKEIDLIVEDAVFDNLVKSAKFKKLPQGDVQDGFDFFYYQLEMEYASYSGNILLGSFENIDAYLLQRFGLSSGDDWREYLYNVVENDVKEKLAFFSVIYNEGLIPTEEEYQREYRRILVSDYEYSYGKTREDFGSDELYETALARYEELMKSGNGESYFSDQVYYNLCMAAIIDMVNVVNDAAGD